MERDQLKAEAKRSDELSGSTIATGGRQFHICRLRNVILVGLFGYLAYSFQPPDWTASSVRLPHYGVCVSGGTIFTAEIDNGFVECIAIRGGVIEFVGKRQDLDGSQSRLGWLNQVIRSWLGLSEFMIHTLDGQVSVLPGLIDAHAHPLEHGEALLGVDLTGCTSVESILERIVKHTKSLDTQDPDFIIRGSGWDQMLFEGKQFPTAASLSNDPRLRGRKIVLRRIDYHAYWVSTAFLNLVLANNDDLDVEGGQVIKDQDGHPTGVFLDNAMFLIDKILPKRTDEDRLTCLRSTAKEMLSVGLTSVNDAAADLETIEFYKKLDAQDQLPVRVTAMINCGYEYCGDKIQKFTGNRFTLRSVKLFLDGALGSWGAALWEPYLDNNSTRGILRVPANGFAPLVQQWVDAGFQVNSHAIGDRANTIVLDGYEKVLNTFNTTSNCKHPFNFARLRIEHAQILRPNDIERIGKLGIIASVQPTHAIADMDYAEARLGSERIRGAYAWNSLLKHNVTLALGSDFPVSPVSPFLGIHAAFTRRKPNLLDGISNISDWYPEERIESMQEIIKGFTSHASFAGFNENQTGSLKVGKLADFIIINHDLFDSQKSRNFISDQILNTNVLATVLNGRVVYGKI